MNRKSARIMLAAALLGMGAALWDTMNATRYREGPVMVPIAAGHGLHRMDLLVLIVLIPLTLSLVRFMTRGRQ